MKMVIIRENGISGWHRPRSDLEAVATYENELALEVSRRSIKKKTLFGSFIYNFEVVHWLI